MNHLLKGAVITVVVILVNLVIHIVCNMHGIDLDSVVTGPVSAVSAMLLYQGWIRNEK